ncbi:MAG: CRTAC1 family protein [Acidobacteriaceae bacterium]|nr:CRTAC1 family protein [Acidobacteriaceae bacterium]
MQRRDFVRGFLALPGVRLFGQGVASRGVKPQPRGKPSGIPFHSRLVDVGAAAGLTFPTIYGSADKKDYIIETVGCGCAFIDYDRDGWMDIFVLSGTLREGPPPNTSNRLYKNNRDGTFSDVTQKAGLFKSGWASAVCVGDYNNDGFDDLVVTYWGGVTLYRNNGDGTFTDVTAESGIPQDKTRWYSGCNFVDYNRDGHLDLFLSSYLQFDFEHVPKPGESANCNWKGIPVNCGPRGLPPGTFSLLKNDGKGRFSDVSEAAGVKHTITGYGMTVVAADFDNDGWPDIYVACDSMPSLLFMNNHDGTFREEGLLRGVALNEDGMEQAGMGIGVGDFDLDGNLDVFKTHFADDTNIVYRNDGKANFEDVTARAGLAVETRFIGWGAGIVDLDNDGLPDLFLVTGNVYPEIEKKLASYPWKTPRVVFRNLGGGKFEELIDEAGPGVAAVHASRGCAFGDFDNDGDVDILVVNLNEPPSLLRNDVSGSAAWIKVKLVGTKSNRSAIGTRVVCKYAGRQQVQEVLSQSSFYSSSDQRLHFGLGAATTVDLEVRWPSGLKQSFTGVAANRFVTITEGSSAIDSRAAPGAGPAATAPRSSIRR